MTMPALQLESLERRLGAFALGPLNLTIQRGAIYALIGPNGAGKTTTLDLLMGMGRPDSGRIRILGMDLDQDEVAIKRRTAYVNPDLNYLAWGSVGRAIDFVRGFYPDWNTERCARLLSAFDLSPREKIGSLSFGARMKLALVMALSREAQLLLLDEPTVGLDAHARRHLFTELLAFMENEDRTIVISSHNLADLERFADHVAIMDRGRILVEGAMDALVGRYTQIDAATKRAVPHIDGLRVLSHGGDRVRLLVDNHALSVNQIQALDLEILAETPLTLEELFLALVDPAKEKAA